jgi:tRNA A-37 threonylcarbamoyl transferase component Bud32
MISFVKNLTGLDTTEEVAINPVKGVNPLRLEKSENEIRNNENNASVKLLNQGTYGCIFRPGIECSSKQLTSKSYITKIQKHREISKNEVLIGEKIQKIAGHEKYYAPILETCDVSVRDLKNVEEAKKCDFMKNADEFLDKQYESNKIRYVGKNTLGDYFTQETANVSQIETYFRKMINIHETVLTGIMKLNDANIMHFDIKENNIMCKNKSGRPILIDYGISVDTTNIASVTVDARNVFFSYTDTYPSWCLDIVMINYMVNNSKNADIKQPNMNAWRGEKASVESTEQVISKYIENNQGIIDGLTKEEKEKYKVDMIAYYKPLVEGGMMNIPTMGNVYDEIIKYHKSWDNYGVAITFLMLLHDLKLQEHVERIPFMKEYTSIMKEIVLSPPDKRPTAGETIKRMAASLSKLSRVDQENMRKALTPDFRNPHNIKERRRKMANVKTESIKRTLLINDKKNIQMKRMDAMKMIDVE